MKNVLVAMMTAFCLVVIHPSVNAQASSGGGLEGFNTALEQGDGPREPTGQMGSGTSSGGGALTNEIRGDWFPFTNLIATNTRISWGVDPSTVEKFVITVADDRSGGEVHYKCFTTSRSHALPLSEMGLSPNKDYVVRIKSADGTLTSPRYVFSILPNKKLNEAMTELKNDAKFKSAEPHVQTLMKAYVMEGLQLNYQAKGLFEVFNANDKIDILYRNMKDRFLERVADQDN